METPHEQCSFPIRPHTCTLGSTIWQAQHGPDTSLGRGGLCQVQSRLCMPRKPVWLSCNPSSPFVYSMLCPLCPGWKLLQAAGCTSRFRPQSMFAELTPVFVGQSKHGSPNHGSSASKPRSFTCPNKDNSQGQGLLKAQPGSLIRSHGKLLPFSHPGSSFQRATWPTLTHAMSSL